MPNDQYAGISRGAFAVQRDYLSFHLMREDIREACAQ